MPDELWSVQASALSYAQMGRPPQLSPDEERMLRQRYLHHSADWHVTGPSWLPSMALLYVNRPTDDGKRVVIPNKDNT